MSMRIRQNGRIPSALALLVTLPNLILEGLHNILECPVFSTSVKCAKSCGFFIELIAFVCCRLSAHQPFDRRQANKLFVLESFRVCIFLPIFVFQNVFVGEYWRIKTPL